MASFFICKKAYLNRYVRLLITAKGLNQRQIAKFLRISPPQFCQILNGSYSVSPQTLKALSQIFKVNSETLTKKGSWRTMSKHLRKIGLRNDY